MTDLAYLEAYVAISAVKARYCLALDTKDWAGFAGVFTEDVELDTRPAGGTLIKGRDALVTMVRTSLETAVTAHQVHPPILTLNGDTAQAIWPMQDRVVFGPERAAGIGSAGLTGYGHYHETYRREAGGWRIATQRLTRLHVDFHPLG